MIKEKYIQNIKETTITIVNSKVDSIRLKNNTKTSIRIYKAGYIGVAGAIGKYDEVELEKEAMEGLKQKIEYPCEPSCDRCEKINKKTEFINDKDLASEVEEFLNELIAMQPDFIFSHKIILQEINTKMFNDKNLDLEYDDKILDIGIIYKEKTSINIMDGFFGARGRKYDRKLLLEEANMILNAYKNKVDLPKSGKYPIVFASSEIPVQKLISDLSGDLFAAGGSLFSDKLGKKVFNENFNFYQSLDPEDVFNTPFFDAEGVVNNNYRYSLIEGGVIKAPYTDKRVAKKYNLDTTGSSSAPYDGVPTLELLSFKVTECEKTIKELLGTEMGILVMIAGGGDFTPSGDFGTPVQLAMLFDGEKLIGRLPEFQISSNVFDMFGDSFRGVGKDMLLPFSNEKFAVIDFNISTI
jgi:PmbA protein